MAFRPATGRKITVEANPRTARALIRRHLREEGKTIEHDLSKWWNVHPHTAYRTMYHKTRKLTPQHVEAVIEFAKLDDFDANDLRFTAAREAGWRIDPQFLGVREGRR